MSASSAHKVLDILLLFNEQQSEYLVEDISNITDIPPSTAYRYVRVLCDKGLLEKSSDGLYHPGPRLLELSRAARSSNRDLRLTALPSMKRIAEQIVETVTLMRIFDNHAMCIESIEGQQVVRVTIEQGRMQPLHAGASSKVLLASLDEGEWLNILDLPLKRLTPNTITDIDELRAEVDHVRTRGYAFSDGEIDLGGKAVAVPVHNRSGKVVGALSIEGPFFRMTDDVMPQYVEILKAEAHLIEAELP